VSFLVTSFNKQRTTYFEATSVPYSGLPCTWHPCNYFIARDKFLSLENWPLFMWTLYLVFRAVYWFFAVTGSKKDFEHLRQLLGRLLSHYRMLKFIVTVFLQLIYIFDFSQVDEQLSWSSVMQKHIKNLQYSSFPKWQTAKPEPPSSKLEMVYSKPKPKHRILCVIQIPQLLPSHPKSPIPSKARLSQPITSKH